ncbi:hypothetical protein [Rhodospirillum sp. A1_3_36]|uniref:hypothetical protein n=1 Tax=Rhodospirillum sp. A1_3_36 TaxID=3391666 RepID=UPI0039A6FF11
MPREIHVTEPFALGSRHFGKGTHLVTEAEARHPFFEPCYRAGRFTVAVTVEAGDLVTAIGQLNPKNSEHFTKAGLPEVKALSEVAGRAVTAQERDAAWAAFQAAKGSE